jgi:antitoxin YqcF
MNKSVPEHYRDVARFVAEAFVGNVSIRQAWDQDETSTIGVLTAIDSPSVDLNSYSTIGFCDTQIHDYEEELSYRAELAMVAQQRFEKARNILATAAFHVINSNWSCHRLAIYPDVVDMYYPEGPMSHLLFTDPFIWDERLVGFSLGDIPVHWLLAAPISESERRYAINFGIHSLLDELDLDRLPVV